MRNAINEFLEQKTIAVVGVSRDGRKFGNAAYRELKAKGYRVFPVHPAAEQVEGDRCYAAIGALPELPGGVLVVVPPLQSEQVVRDTVRAGIKRIWLQQGAESAASIRFCEENGVALVHGQCILMFAEPAQFFHRLHRGIWRLLGKLP